MPANPANPEEGLDQADGPVNGAPERMLQVRIVEVGLPSVKEEEDPSKRLVVKYDPYMQVVNGMLGSNAGNMHRLGEILRGAVDTNAQEQFAESIQGAVTEALNAVSAAYDADIVGLKERIEELEKELEEATKPAVQRAKHTDKKD